MTRTVFRGGTVFDGTGADPASADVVVEGGRIVDVGPGLDGDDDVDCSGRTIYPGLIDCHVHFMADGDLDPMTPVRTPFSMNFFLAAERMQRTLAAGVTTIREAGGSDLGVKQAQASGMIPGPRMQIAITILSQTGGHGDSWQVCGAHMPGILGNPHPGKPHNIVDGPEEMRRKVRELVRAGADVIKVCTSGGVLSPRDDPRHGHFRDDELRVLVAEAEAAGKWVMAHAQATDGIKSAIRTGIRSIEHGIYMDDEAIEMMLKAGTYLVPTLVAPMGVLEAADRGVAVPAYAIEKTKMVIETHRESIRRCIAAGVRVAMGTDSGVTPHGQNVRELEQYVDCGMTPAEAFVSATRTAAELMGLENEVGTIAAGRRADLVVTDAAALDIAGLKTAPRDVYQDGRKVA
jgi:imidazolonepropionase-like amidohydrolase